MANGKRTDGGRSRIAPLALVSSRVGGNGLAPWEFFVVGLRPTLPHGSHQQPSSLNWTKDERCRCTS